MISHQHKVIFIHIPKCAGRSISQALEQDFDHHTASYYENEWSDCWNDYTIFTTVRNPYGRLVSMYHYIKKEPFHAGHAITNWGNMIPFKEWVLQNIASFKGEFEKATTEGARETDGDIGSAFWFSSQTSRIANTSNDVYNNVHILRYEDGMQSVQEFFLQRKGIEINIPHINNSGSNYGDDYMRYYDQELLDAVNSFPPFVKDLTLLNYKMVTKPS